MQKKYFLEKNGCNTHNHELERLNKYLKDNSYLRTTNIFEADVIIEFFCAISTENLRGIAKKMQIISAIKKFKPNVQCIIGGCASGKNVVPFKKLYPNVVDFEYSRSKFSDKILNYLKIETSENPNDIFVNVDNNSSFIRIQSGCLRHCSFCKAAYMDMSLESLPMDVILKNISFAIQNGAKYITLTGENTTEYGIDIYGESKLLDLLKEIEKIDGNYGIALMGICIDELKKEEIEFIRNSEHIKKLQIEAQSFMPMVRNSMGLSKKGSEIVEILNTLSRKSIISNVMIGHPIDSRKYSKSEIDSRFWTEFNESLNIIRENNFYFLSINTLDATPQTPSYEMPQISDLDKSKMILNLYKSLDEIIKEQIEKLSNEKTKIEAYFISKGNHFYIFEACTMPLIIKVSTETVYSNLAPYDIVNINVEKLESSIEQNGKDMQYIVVYGRII